MTKLPSSFGATVIFTCSGASNVGRIAEQAAVDMQQEGLGCMGCLAGIGSHDENIRVEARNAERIVGIDGCADACSRKALEQAGLDVTDHVVVTDLGVQKKTHAAILDSTIIARVKNAVKARLETVPAGPFCS